MRTISTMAALLALTATGTLAAQDNPKSPHPLTATSVLPPPSATDRERRAAVTPAPYRYDDILWENDRIAHRLYGRALEAVEPPSGSGIDVWAKNVRWPFMDRQLRTTRQHDYQGEGLDFYNVRGGRGAGGLGIWFDNKLWVSRNYARSRILKNEPDVASFEIQYDPWPVDVARKVWETRSFTLPAGTNFTRMVSTLNSDRPGSLIVGIGISKRPTSETKLGTFTADKTTGRVSWWGPSDPADGTMAVALMVDPKTLVGMTEDYDNYLVLVRVQPGMPFVYYMGAAWDKGLDFHNQAEWDRYVAEQKPDFDTAHR
ncbi:DUF4861 domain-containing protein [Sphingomonas sp. QA11]|uniref:DUF4861 family protein n=1 Tax=Sphingomonas sp. QA11 TaxID=2950605 RepID=UPI00234B3EEA|nr:DUF4861 family protein [Sphingomonas sp. QA11]WCM26359.1 DUF4861 domain-containing protein [Sphingomonas sp. QA11]